jgi:hypothetical protein
MGIKYTNCIKIDRIAVKFTNFFHCKTTQNLPKLGILVRKHTIWQPWPKLEKWSLKNECKHFNAFFSLVCMHICILKTILCITSFILWKISFVMESDPTAV